MKNILKVRMLGGFTLEYKGKELVLDRNNVSKTTQLFELLLLHTQDGGISKAALIDALYGRSDVENKNGSLNNTIFRLRKQLTAAGLPESSYININGGMCTWDPDIETSVDVCDFKQTIESARHEKSQKTKMEIYAKAWKLYTGEFLPDMMGEDWAAVENIACRDMYFDCVEEPCHYLKTEEKFEELNAKLYKVGVRAQFYSALTNPSTRFVNGLVYAGVGIFGALSAIGGGITVGQLSAFLSYANQYTKPFNEISGVVTELQSAFASARRIFALTESDDEISDADNKVLTDVSGNVKIDHVDFSYVPEKELIKDLNLDVKSGQQIAIVGPTGCGKTTIINLLMRFYDTDKGGISVDGNNIKDVTRDSLRLSYGMVLQETWIFEGTVRENIAYGKQDATEEEIVAAAKAAHCHSFIKRMKDGYDTIISDNDGISQGQKQLLCIARVMLAMPPMLILDEATSSIDTKTEMKIQNAFAKMTKGKTSFIVAHRLSTIKNADTILVMDKGRIIEIGNHDQLLAKNGFYAELYNSQFKKT